MKLFTAVVAAGVFATVLTGCSQQGSSGDCTPLVQSGSAVDSITVSGKFGQEPTVKFEAPIKASATERKVIVNGEGPGAQLGDSVGYEVSLYSSKTGEEITKTTYGDDQPEIMVLDENQMIKGFLEALVCSNAGSQVVSYIAPSSLLLSSGQPAGNLAADEGLVAVFDVMSVTEPSTPLPRASGEPQTPESGLPTVTLDDSGVPTISVPATAAPTELKVSLLQKGSGPVVKPHAMVTVHYTGVLWSDGSTFDSSWEAGTPAEFNLDGVVGGFAQAIEGQTVGSQVLVVIPPELAYGDQEKPGIPANSTLVFVIDILATNP